MFLPLRRYATIDGRATRREFWLFHLFFYVVALGLVLTTASILEANGSEAARVLTLLPFLFFIGMIVPMISVSIRRLHDHDKTGWFLLLSLIPFVGWLFWIFMMVQPGTQGENSYGPDPRDPDSDRLATVFE